MLISESMQKIIRVLLNKKELTLRELSIESNVSLGLTVKITNQLKLTGYIKKKVKIKVIKYYKLLNAWAYSVSLKEIPRIGWIIRGVPLTQAETIAEHSASLLWLAVTTLPLLRKK